MHLVCTLLIKTPLNRYGPSSFPSNFFAQNKLFTLSQEELCIDQGARFGSVRLRFGGGTVRAVPVFGPHGSSKEGVFVRFSTV